MRVMTHYFEPQILYGIAGPKIAEMSGLIISVEDRYCTAAFNPPCLHSGFIKWRHTAVRANSNLNGCNRNRLFF